MKDDSFKTITLTRVTWDFKYHNEIFDGIIYILNSVHLRERMRYTLSLNLLHVIHGHYNEKCNSGHFWDSLSGTEE